MIGFEGRREDRHVCVRGMDWVNSRKLWREIVARREVSTSRRIRCCSNRRDSISIEKGNDELYRKQMLLDIQREHLMKVGITRRTIPHLPDTGQCPLFLRAESTQGY